MKTDKGVNMDYQEWKNYVDELTEMSVSLEIFEAMLRDNHKDISKNLNLAKIETQKAIVSLNLAYLHHSSKAHRDSFKERKEELDAAK